MLGCVALVYLFLIFPVFSDPVLLSCQDAQSDLEAAGVLCGYGTQRHQVSLTAEGHQGGNWCLLRRERRSEFVLESSSVGS